MEAKEVITNNRKKRMYLNVLFHNKGIEMLNLPGILHRNGMKKTVPTFLDHKEPLILTPKLSLVKYLTIKVLSAIWILTLVHRIERSGPKVDEWVHSVYDKKIDYLSRKVISKRQILRNEKHRRALSILHDKCPSNNIIVICILRGCVESASKAKGTQMTYEMVTKDNNESAIIGRHVEDMKNRNIRLPSEMRKLPCIYWLPKLLYLVADSLQPQRSVLLSPCLIYLERI